MGARGGSILNYDCDDVDIPIKKYCTHGWIYVSNGALYNDDTITLTCIGNKILGYLIKCFTPQHKNQKNFIVVLI